MMRRIAAVLVLALSSGASAQVRASAGVGGGIAGSTASSLSNGTSGPMVMAEVTSSIAPVIGIGVAGDYWWRGGEHVAVATGIVQLHFPLTKFYLSAGAGYGNGDPDGGGAIRGAAGRLGAAYDITFPASPVALTLFGHALLAHASARSLQMVAGGVAITW